jgi:glycosyltransferase involved in cell wall biosynthesis
MLISAKNLELGNIGDVFLDSTTSKKPAQSVVVPTYNESENIIVLVSKIETLSASVFFELIIVDDNSPDGAHRIAETLNGRYRNITTLRRSGKLGLSQPFSQGLRLLNLPRFRWDVEEGM